MVMGDKAETTIPINKLRQILIDCFNESELQNLVFDLGIDYENLPGKSKEDKTRELIAFLERRGRVSELVRVCYQLRPNLPWEEALGREDLQISRILHTKPDSQAIAQHRDNFAPYEIGLLRLLEQIGINHSRYMAFLRNTA